MGDNEIKLQGKSCAVCLESNQPRKERGTQDSRKNVPMKSKKQRKHLMCLPTKQDVLQICKRVWGWIIYRYIENTRPSRTNTKRRCPFHHREMECKSRKAGDSWSNRQAGPWSTEWSRAKANRVLPRERTGHSKHPLPTAQETTLHMVVTRWSITDQGFPNSSFG